MTLYYLGNARSEDQRQEMIALEAAGICIFCPSAYSHDHTQREVLLDYNTVFPTRTGTGFKWYLGSAA